MSAVPNPAAVDRRIRKQLADLAGWREQRLIEAELWASRRALWRAVRSRADGELAVLRDRQFLAVADAPMIFQTIIVAALVADTAHGVDLQIRSPVTGAPRVVARHGRPTPPARLDGGDPVVRSYPLVSERGDVLGLLSLHYATARPEVTPEPVRRVVAAATHALRCVECQLDS